MLIFLPTRRPYVNHLNVAVTSLRPDSSLVRFTFVSKGSERYIDAPEMKSSSLLKVVGCYVISDLVLERMNIYNMVSGE